MTATKTRAVRQKDEVAPQDISDIEDGEVKRDCFNCRHRQVKTVKVMPREDQENGLTYIKTKNFTGVCQNKECFRYQDMTKTPSWIRI